MPRRKLNYQNGTRFFIPLRTGGFARGVVARSDGRGVILGYFYGPKLEQPGPDFGVIAPGEAVLIGRCGDLGLLEGDWPLAGEVVDWELDDWPLTPLFREDEVDGKAWLSHYDDNLNFIREETVSPELRDEYPYDRLMGYGAAEIRLTNLLDTE